MILSMNVSTNIGLILLIFLLCLSVFGFFYNAVYRFNGNADHPIISSSLLLLVIGFSIYFLLFSGQDKTLLGYSMLVGIPCLFVLYSMYSIGALRVFWICVSLATMVYFTVSSEWITISLTRPTIIWMIFMYLSSSIMIFKYSESTGHLFGGILFSLVTGSIVVFIPFALSEDTTILVLFFCGAILYYELKTDIRKPVDTTGNISYDAWGHAYDDDKTYSIDGRDAQYIGEGRYKDSSGKTYKETGSGEVTEEE